MPGVTKHHIKRDYRRAFPASHYDDPRGGRASALERNILRYRATEATLYLFYAEEVRDFMLTDVHRAAIRQPGEEIWEAPKERRLQRVFADLLRDAETDQKLPAEDAEAFRRAFASERQQGKKLKVAFAYAVTIGMFTEAEAAELKALLDYRNDIAHRIHLVMSGSDMLLYVRKGVPALDNKPARCGLPGEPALVFGLGQSADLYRARSLPPSGGVIRCWRFVWSRTPSDPRLFP